MKAVFFQMLVILCLSGITKLIAQAPQPGSQQKETAILEIDIERDFKPASSKTAIENQALELRDIIKQKRKEVQECDDYYYQPGINHK
ncbi:MAG: hypothetical protein H7Y86_04260 [Rhizobacter sp.]|nr:hypothetical protein [Ferruginibacter sp.]